MKKVIEGAAESSYGIYAAKIAGAPHKVIQRASEILKKLENEAGIQVENIEINNKKSPDILPFNSKADSNVNLVDEKEKIESEVEKEIKDLNINDITPIEALNLINKWKRDLNN